MSGGGGCNTVGLFNFSEMLVTGVQTQYSMMEAHACQIFKLKKCVSGKDREKEDELLI